MPRRNRRDEIAAGNVYDMLGPEYRPTWDQAERERRAALRAERAASARQQLRCMRCVVPDCVRATVPGRSTGEIPLCWDHAVAVWQMVERRQHQPRARSLIEASQQQAERERAARETEDAEEKKRRLTEGHIYFVRQNGLIKVGWSSQIRRRLKAYGPNVEILCQYPASKQDETLLHRQLTPYRAKGREWYEDCRLIADMVADTVERWGEPQYQAYWSEPKAPAPKPRHWTGLRSG